jgi:hypothetical protein
MCIVRTSPRNERGCVFERFIARQAILKDNLTLLGYELRFRTDDSGAAAPSGSSAAYLVDASTIVFHWELLTANALAFVSLSERELLSGVALVLPRSKAVVEIADSVPATPKWWPAVFKLARQEELARLLGLSKNSSGLVPDGAAIHRGCAAGPPYDKNTDRAFIVRGDLHGAEGSRRRVWKRL